MSTLRCAIAAKIHQLCLLSLVTVVSACGGGGSDSGTPPFGGGDGGGEVIKAADLIVTLDSYTLQNTGGDAVTVTVTAVDANRNVLGTVPVTMSVDSAAVIAPSGTTTDSAGTITGAVTLGADRSNRTVTVTAVSDKLTKQATFQVYGAKIVASLVGSVSPNSTNNQITYRVSDANSNPMANADISVSAPGLTTATGVTDINGTYVFTYTAPTSPGGLTITAAAAGISDIEVVQVVANDGTVPPAVGPVSSASLSANPSVVPVNVTGTSNQSELRALFNGANNKPIANIRARFNWPKTDENNTGGEISTGTSLLYSNANGIVTSAYRPGSRSSPTDGVKIRVCWDYVDFTADACPNFTETKLTVTSEPLSVTIGTNAEIIIGEEKLTYIKQYVVMVVDSAGVAKAGVTVSPVLDLPSYWKGIWTITTDGWTYGATAHCTAEDTDRNGILDTGEDVNNNGSLEPRKADILVEWVSGDTTNSSGLVVLQLRYPQSIASWADYVLTVAANGVSGTEGRASFAGVLPVPASALSDTTTAPAFVRSPYGMVGSCTDKN